MPPLKHFETTKKHKSTGFLFEIPLFVPRSFSQDQSGHLMTFEHLFARTGAVAVLLLATSSHPQQARDVLMNVTFPCQDIG